jgi:sec-independent protein translocase protein TatA
MFGLGWQELLIVLAIVLIIFGAGRLTNIGRDLGTAVREFRDSVRNPEKEEASEDEKPGEQS